MTIPAHTKTHNLPAAAKPTHTSSKAPSSPPAYYSHSSRSSQCTPFKSTFGSGSVGSKGSSSSSEPFVAVSPDGSWALGEGGLELYMEKPKGDVKTEGGINDVVADGATVNSTFTMLYGKVTFEVQSPKVAGMVTAVILIADEHDEIDIELVGGDASHWQSNIYSPAPTDTEPLWGVFGQVEDYADGSVGVMHSYTIDWTEDRIVWSVDGKAVRTIKPDETMKNGGMHYPQHAAKIQLGIWDASNPLGTSQWAKGPIDWNKAPAKMTAVVKSVTVECA